jgi:hypothetical protein
MLKTPSLQTYEEHVINTDWQQAVAAGSKSKQ